MKLDIGKSYIVYTTNDYISNKQIRILGYISYEKAAQYKNFVENVAINEKFINESGDTAAYLKNQIYYDCAVIKLTDGEYLTTGEHLILWDDILDIERTQRLYENYTYKLEFKFKNFSNTDSITKDSVIKSIQNIIDNQYNSHGIKVDISLTEITDSELNNAESQLDKAQSVISNAADVLKTFINLENSAKEITANFTDNNINQRVTAISNNLTSIEDSISTIIANLK